MKRNLLTKFLLITASVLFLLSCRDFFGDRAQPESIVNASDGKTNIVITSPIFASIWKPGEAMPIKWIANSFVEKIDIELYRKSVFQIKITNGTNNDGSYVWNIPNNINHSVQYLLKVYNHNNPDEFVLSERFAIQD